MSININDLSREILFISIVIYFSQGALYATGSMLSQAAIFLILFISGIFSIKCLLLKYGYKRYYLLLILFLMINFFGFLLSDFSDPLYSAQFKNILIALMPFFPFYYFAYKNRLTEKHLLRFFLIMIIIAIIRYYSNINSTIAERISDNENVVSNTAYLFVGILPYIFLWKEKKYIGFTSLVVILYFVIQSSKRGALLTGLIGAITFLYYQLHTSPRRNRVKNYTTLAFGSSISAYVLYKFYISNEFLISRLENLQEGGSGRDIIYSSLWNNWLDSASIINTLFGYGFMSTPKFNAMGQLAHNDWLEVLTNYGIVGIVIYCLLITSLFPIALNKKIKFELKLIMITIILMWLLRSMFSMYYTSINTIFSSILIGYILGTYSKNKASNLSIDC